MEKRLKEALEKLRAYATERNFSYSISPFADGILHAVEVIEAAIEAELTQRLMDPQDSANEGDKK